MCRVTGRRVGLYTLGCKVSQYETEAIAEDFERRGFCVCDFDEVCDVYVINTCTVTAESDRKSRQMIRRAVSRNPDALVMVTGCYAQTSPDAVARIPGVAYICGSGGKMKIAEAALALLGGQSQLSPFCAVTAVEEEPFERMSIAHAPRTRAYVKIEDGCECRCSYCAIPGARGRVRSKNPDDVVAEVEALCRGGTGEVVLTGIETASYGADLADCRLIDLLERLENQSGVRRIRLGSLTPELMRPDFVARAARLGKLAPHFHLSVQSGSDAVLRGMRRRYSAAQALEGIERVRQAMPHVNFTTDVMVGFPGESDENFAETEAFCRRAGFLDMHIFAYSPRPGTPAASYPDQVPEAIKRRRSHALLQLRDELHAAACAAAVAAAEPLSVLFESCSEGVWSGHSDNFFEVAVRSRENLHGRFATVLPTGVSGGRLSGTLLTVDTN